MIFVPSNYPSKVPLDYSCSIIALFEVQHVMNVKKCRYDLHGRENNDGQTIETLVIEIVSHRKEVKIE